MKAGSDARSPIEITRATTFDFLVDRIRRFRRKTPSFWRSWQKVVFQQPAKRVAQFHFKFSLRSWTLVFGSFDRSLMALRPPSSSRQRKQVCSFGPLPNPSCLIQSLRTASKLRPLQLRVFSSSLLFGGPQPSIPRPSLLSSQVSFRMPYHQHVVRTVRSSSPGFCETQTRLPEFHQS